MGLVNYALPRDEVPTKAAQLAQGLGVPVAVTTHGELLHADGGGVQQLLDDAVHGQLDLRPTALSARTTWAVFDSLFLIRWASSSPPERARTRRWLVAVRPGWNPVASRADPTTRIGAWRSW